jgi:hypothetical protein
VPFAKGIKHGPEVGDKSAQRARGLARTANLPVLPAPPDGMDMDEWAVPIAQAAELVRVSQQSLQKSAIKGFLAVYQWRGIRYVLHDDLAKSAACRRERAHLDEIERCRAQAAFYRDRSNLAPSTTEAEWQTLVRLWEARAEDAEAGCRAGVEGPAGLAARLDWERACAGLPPIKPKRPWHDPDGKRRRQLEVARAAKVPADAERRLARERAITETRARLAEVDVAGSQ